MCSSAAWGSRRIGSLEADGGGEKVYHIIREVREVQVEKDKNGKSVLKNYEIDFYATKGVKTFYVQVTDNRNQESTKARELAPYRLIRDANAKYVLVNQKLPMQKLENGVLLQDVVDFLLSL